MITKENIGKFDSISIFNENYLLVERNGLFNLLDNNGDYVSKTWYKEITKNNGGGADFVENNKTNTRVQMRSIPMIHTYGEVRRTLTDNSILSRIDTRCICVVAPFSIRSIASNRTITIIAKVTIFGKELLLGKNGKLYEKVTYDEVKEYVLPEFFISLTDINRLVDVADNFNRLYNSEYNASAKPETTSKDDLVGTKTACWIFGFSSTKGMSFNSSRRSPIGETTTVAWGGDTIKVRIDNELIPELYRENFTVAMKELEFESGSKTTNWYTKEYTLEDLNILFDDMRLLFNKLDYVKR